MIFFHKGVRQHDSRDCGAACLATVCEYYGTKVPLVKMRELCRVDKNGSNFLALINAANFFNLKGKALTGNWDELCDALRSQEVHNPFIAHVIVDEMLEHYVVVWKITRQKVFTFDPAFGNITLTIEKFQQMWTGYLLSLDMAENYKKQNLRRGMYKKYFLLFSEHKNLIVTTFIISVIISIMSASVAFAYQIMIDTFIFPSSLGGTTDQIAMLLGNIHYLFLALLVLILLKCIFSAVRGVLLAYVSKKIDNFLIESYLCKILQLPLSYFHDRKTGEIISRLGDLAAIREAISNISLTIILDSLMVIAMGFILYLISSLLFMAIVIISLLYLLSVFLFLPKMIMITKKIMEADAQLISILKEVIDGIETVKAFSAESHINKKLKYKTKSLVDYIFHGAMVEMGMMSFIGVLENIGLILILWIGGYLVTQNELSLGTLIAFESLAGFFTGAIQNLMQIQPIIQTSLVAADRLNDILEATPEKDSGSNYLPESLYKPIVFSDVSFCYGYRQEVLQHINFEIIQGEKVAFVGESGCGKTTIARLLLKLYSPTSGDIKIDNCSINNIPNDIVRRKIAYISQEVFLFADTIKNNLLISTDDISDEKINKMLDICNIKSFLKDLPSGINTIVDENGKSLSGGQKQRIAIARALLMDPDVIIFDEATSNLDNITEQSILNLIYKNSKICTTIIIAHKLKTIRDCDRILVLKNGEIIESGSHSDLLKDKGKYFEMYNQEINGYKVKT